MSCGGRIFGKSIVIIWNTEDIINKLKPSGR